MKTIILLFFVFFSTSAMSDPLDYVARTTQVMALAGLYADWHTTREAGKYYYTPNPRTGLYHNETGMHHLFGKYPSAGEINSYFISYALINLAVNKWAPKPFAIFFNSYQFTSHYNAYTHNVSFGLSKTF